MREAGAGVLSGAAEWVIEPRTGGVASRLREAWEYRGLLLFFARQTVGRFTSTSAVGWLWILARPLMPVAIMVLVFGELAGFPSDGVPYPLFVLAGMTAWNLFEETLIWSTRSFHLHGRLLTRLYFPRLIVPIASTPLALLNFAVHLVLTLAMSVYFFAQTGVLYVSGQGFVLALTVAGVAWLFGLGLGYWATVVDAPQRDVRYTLRYVLRFWYFLTPVVYPLSFVEGRWRWLILLNPVTGIVETYRAFVFGHAGGGWSTLGVSVALVALVLVTGLVVFDRFEARLVDRL